MCENCGSERHDLRHCALRELDFLLEQMERAASTPYPGEATLNHWTFEV